LQRDDERESDFDADYQRQPILAITRLLKSEGAVVICRRGLVKEGFCGKKTGASGLAAARRRFLPPYEIWIALQAVQIPAKRPTPFFLFIVLGRGAV
jgi:hypothetical protein